MRDTIPPPDPGRRTIRWLIQLAVTALVTWFIFRAVGLQLDDLRAVELSRWRPRGPLLGLSCILLLAGYGMSASLWGGLVRALGGPRLPAGVSVRIFLVANLGRYLPGKLWQIAGLALLARKEGVSAPVATSAAVVGQGFALVGATLVGATAFLEAGAAYRQVGIAILAVGLAGVLLAAVPGLTRRVLSFVFRLLGRTLPEGVVPGPGFAPLWIALYTVNWVLYAGAFRLLAQAFGLPGTFLQTAPAFAAAYVVGYLAVFSPAGIGVREGVLTLFLAPVTGHGPAATLSLVARLWTTAVEIVPAGALWLVGLRRAGREGEGNR